MRRHGTVGGARRRLLAGTTGWYSNWTPDVVVDPADSNATAQSKIDANIGGIVGFGSGVHVERNVNAPNSTTQGTRFIGRADGSTVFDGSRDVGTDGWANNGNGTWTKAIPGANVPRSADWNNIDWEPLTVTGSDGNLYPKTGTIAAQTPEELWVKQGSDWSSHGDDWYTGYSGWRRLHRRVTTEDELAGDTGTAHTIPSYMRVTTPGVDEWVLAHDDSAYANPGTITIGTDPATFDEIRLAVQPWAVFGRNYIGMTVADLTLDRYACFTRDAPLGAQIIQHFAWDCFYVTVRGAHGPGFNCVPGGIVDHCLSAFNGRFGIGGNDFGWWAQNTVLGEPNDPTVTVASNGVRWDIQNSRFAYNLLIDFNDGHGGGGTKLGVESESSRTNPSRVHNSLWEFNNHHGIWLDHAFENNPGRAKAEVTSNMIRHNASRGLYGEIWDVADVLIEHNEIHHNGVGSMPGSPLFEVPSLLTAYAASACQGFRFLNNYCYENNRGMRYNDADRSFNVNKDGGSPRLLNCHDAGNVIHVTDDVAGAGTQLADDGKLHRYQSAFSSDETALRSCTSDNNTYVIPVANNDDFRYEADHTGVTGSGNALDWAQWQALDRSPDAQLDRNSTFTVADTPSPPADWTPFAEQYYGAGSGND